MSRDADCRLGNRDRVRVRCFGVTRQKRVLCVRQHRGAASGMWLLGLGVALGVALGLGEFCI